MKNSYRYRLPEGFSELRNNVGEILREAREASTDFGKMPKKQFAHRVGIARETLSRIENGERWPSYSTLAEMIGLLPIEWDDIAIATKTSCNAIPSYPDECAELGEALRRGRKKEDLTLREVADLTGLSVSQLSRTERGLFTRGRFVEVIFYDGVKTFDSDAIVRFTHPKLKELAERGGYDSEIGRRTRYD